MVACYKGFIDIVVVLSKCPYINVNHQDNEGNTALMISAQAGRRHAGYMQRATTVSRNMAELVGGSCNRMKLTKKCSFMMHTSKLWNAIVSSNTLRNIQPNMQK